jgi:hypothetical protein
VETEVADLDQAGGGWPLRMRLGSARKSSKPLRDQLAIAHHVAGVALAQVRAARYGSPRRIWDQPARCAASVQGSAAGAYNALGTAAELFVGQALLSLQHAMRIAALSGFQFHSPARHVHLPDRDTM